MNPVPRKVRDKLLRRADILNAATRVFAEKGYHQATMLDIAKQAEYAVGTLYLYFKDKQALYFALTEEKIDDLFRKIKDKIRSAQGSLEKIRVLVEEEFVYFEENKDFFRIYFSEEGVGKWAIKDKPSLAIMEKSMRFIGYTSGIICQAQEEGVIRKGLDPQKTANLLGGMIKSLIIPWLRDSRSGGEGLKGLSGFVLNVFLNGTAAKRAGKIG